MVKNVWAAMTWLRQNHGTANILSGVLSIAFGCAFLFADALAANVFLTWLGGAVVGRGLGDWANAHDGAD